MFPNSFLFRQNLLYVRDGPPRLQVLQHCHESPMAGHFGVRKTLDLISRHCWWPLLRNFVEGYVQSCDIYVVDQRVVVTDPMAYYNHFPFRKLIGSRYLWTSLLISQFQKI